MREIKFRGQRVDNRQWVVGYLYQSELKSWITDSRNINLETHRNIAWFQVDPTTVGQFTGLMDKNGKEIYEGDLAQCTDAEGNISVNNSDTGIAQVVFLENWGLWYVDGPINNGLADLMQDGYVEVIGNIFDNSEKIEKHEQTN